MDEATKLLSATCDTFIKTLEECMKLSSANVIYELPQPNDVTVPPVPANINAIAKKVCTESCCGVCLTYLFQNCKNMGRLNSMDA